MRLPCILPHHRFHLDYVIQIDSPSTVSSFLQRMGRTGRRFGSRRNFLFLTTTDEAFLLACAITTLWRGEYVEHIKPPPMPSGTWWRSR